MGSVFVIENVELVESENVAVEVFSNELLNVIVRVGGSVSEIENDKEEENELVLVSGGVFDIDVVKDLENVCEGVGSLVRV